MVEFEARELTSSVDNSRGGKEGWRSRIKGIVSAVVFLGLAYLLLGWIAQAAVSMISPQTESKWFRWTDQVFADGPPPPERMQGLFERLLQDPELADFDYRLVMLESDDMNAFAVPGGMVGFTTSLVEEVHSDIGLAFVLGHELGHLQHRHGLDRLGRSLLTALSLSWTGIDNSFLLKGSVNLAELSFSRQQELEADAFGLELVMREFGTAEGAMEFFEVVQAMEELGPGTPSRLTNFLSTHPLTPDRIRALEAQTSTGPSR